MYTLFSWFFMIDTRTLCLQTSHDIQGFVTISLIRAALKTHKAVMKARPAARTEEK
jgi:hypothetical protein